MAVLQKIKAAVRGNDELSAAATKLYLKAVQPFMVRRSAADAGLRVRYGRDTVEVTDGTLRVRLALRHAIYLDDVIRNFHYFTGAVQPEADGLVDYSAPKSHRVVGFDLHPIIFPSLAEPVATTEQYLDFAGLTDGAVAIDLGAYSGLTSIMFRERCGASGRVIAVDADADNLAAIRANLAAYHAATGRTVELLEGAVWTHRDGISFSAEGNMGSSAVEIVGNRVGAARLVPSFTLADIADRFALKRVDFIKCDIEGAEAVIFGDAAFFTRFRPRILVEVHPVAGTMTTDAVKAALAPHGYRFNLVEQAGDSLPLLECVPTPLP